MDHDALYKALRARDKRFDGRFYVGVRTTGIYCRPVCPARPLRKNVQFYKSAAEAEGAGFRACLRCRPDLSPASPLFQGTAAVVGRALRLIAEGGADDASLRSLADKLGITDRHLRRLFAEHVGASPVEVASSKRLHLARLLLAETALPVTEIAYASGFRSLRRFHAAFAHRYQRAPREFRREGGARGKALALRIPVLEPFGARQLFAFFARHSTPGCERVIDGAYERLLPGGGTLRVAHEKGFLLVSVEGGEVRALRDTIERTRRLFDVDHNPALLPRELRGVRVPGAFDGFETAVNIILGQAVSVESARACSARLLRKLGEPVKHPVFTHLFPSAARLAEADFSGLGIPRSRARAVQGLARSGLSLERSAPLAETRARLAAIPGIGPWTTELIAMRCLGDPDAFPANDLVVARALPSLLPSRRANQNPERLRPWRAYYTLWLWQNLYRKEKK